MNSAYVGLAAVALYIVGSFIQIQALARRASTSRMQLFVLATPAVALHGLSIYLVIRLPDGFDIGFFAVLSLVFFILATLVLVTSLWQPLENLFTLVFPLAALAVIGSLSAAGPTVPASTFSNMLIAHILVSISAYSVLMFAAFQSVAISVQEAALKKRASIGLLRLLPPLQTMEAFLFQLLWIGLVLLTVSVAGGFLFLDLGHNVVHHTVLASASWIVFVVLLIGHHALGWRGTTATRWTLAGFVLLLLAYFGSKFVVEIILDRAA